MTAIIPDTRNLVMLLTVFMSFVSMERVASKIIVKDQINVHNDKTFFDKFEEASKMKHKMGYISSKENTDTLLYLQPYFEMMSFVLDDLHTRNSTAFTKFKYGKIQVMFELLEKIKVKDFVEKRIGVPCMHDIFRLFKSLIAGEPWAVSFFDSFGKPGPSVTNGWLGFVGSYDQCRQSKSPDTDATARRFEGKYCNLLLGLEIDPAPIIVGLCSPVTCSSQQITIFFKSMMSLLNSSDFSVDDVQCITGETTISTATVFAIIILSVFGSLAILGTFYDVFVAQRDKIWTYTLDPEEPSNINNLSHDEQESKVSIADSAPLLSKTVITQTRHSKAAKLVLFFSIYSNGKQVLSTSCSQGSIRVINGIRFLSMNWVVLGHSIFYSGPGIALNFPTAIQIFLGRWTFDAVLNGVFAVDTFFTLSGLLTSYITMKQLWSRGVRINWAMFYFHRFWRLTPPYMFVLVIVLGLQQYLGHGPLWSDVQPADKMYCEKNWWTNLLYINNLVRREEPCFIHSWYLADDMQFFLISPLMLIPFYYSKIAGLLTCACLLVISWIATGVLSSQNAWGVTILSSLKSDWFTEYYITPWCRLGPFVLGIITGYILAAKGAKPFKMKCWVVTVGWIVAVASALAVVYGIDGYFGGFGEHPDEKHRDVRALYNALSRTVWSACVCWVIIACTAGYGGPVNALLSWSPFVVLGRLNFMTYLFHVPVINVFYGNFGSMYFMNTATVIVMFLGLLVICNMMAFVGVLLLESPMIRLEKAFLRRRERGRC